MQRVYVVGGHIRDGDHEKGNVFTVPSNSYAEFNMFLDPLAAKTVLESRLDITLIPLNVQRKVASFEDVLAALKQRKQLTPESRFVHSLISLLQELQRKQKLYHHMVNGPLRSSIVTRSIVDV
jgi:inosine-uridine nucleoside N-ribohydrolase